MRLDLFIIKDLSSLLKETDFSKEEVAALTELPRSFWQKEINLGNIKIRNKLTKPSFNISSTKFFSLNIDWKKIKKNWNVFYRKRIISYPAPLNLVLVNPAFLVVNKPAGLAVHPTFPLNQQLSRNPSLIEILNSYYPETELIHRLDKETTGIILVAKNSKTKIYLKKQFKDRRVVKIYYALVEGDFPYNKFKISGLIGKLANNPIKRGVTDLLAETLQSAKTRLKLINPKDSLTYGEKVASGNLEELKRIKRPVNKLLKSWGRNLKNKDKKFTLLRVIPKTGRTHQIRVHLSAVGFPIVGDKLYGKSNYKNLPFHCLHAHSIEWQDQSLKMRSARSDEVTIF